MQQIFSSRFLHFMSICIMTLAVAKLLWVVAALFLPALPPEAPMHEARWMASKRLHLAEKFSDTAVEEKKDVSGYVDLKHVKLKAIFRKGKGGFTVLEDRRGVHYLDIGEKFGGYRLKKLFSHYVLLEKEGALFKMELEGYAKRGKMKK